MERRKTEQSYLVIALLLLASMFLSACGEEGDRQRGINGYLYVAEEISMDQEEKTDYRICGNYLYYFYPSRHTLYRIPLNGEVSAEGTGAKSEVVVESSSEHPVLCYTVDDDMSVYYYKGVMQKKGYFDVEMVKGELVKCQEDGTQIYRRTFDIGAESGVEARLVSLAVDGSGRSFLLAGESIYVTDASGESLGSVSVQEYRPSSQSGWETEKLLEGADGRVYYHMIDQSKPDMAVYEILGNGPDFRLERLMVFILHTD